MYIEEESFASVEDELDFFRSDCVLFDQAPQLGYQVVAQIAAILRVVGVERDGRKCLECERHIRLGPAGDDQPKPGGRLEKLRGEEAGEWISALAPGLVQTVDDNDQISGRPREVPGQWLSD